MPRQTNNKTRRISIRDTIDTPNGFFRIELNNHCKVNMTPNAIKTNIHNLNYDISSGCINQLSNNNNLNTCSKQKIIRSASTVINPNKEYYPTTKQYLQSRVKLHNQRQSFHKITGIDYTSPPNNSSTGSQNFYSTSCCQANTCDGSNCNFRIIYKPNNTKFIQQGAVSNGLRIARLKVDTITKNAHALKNEWGPAAASAAKYRGNSDTPFFNKSKYEKSCPNKTKSRQYSTGGVGSHTVCFYTPGNEIVNNSVNYTRNKSTKTGTGNKFITSKIIDCKQSLARIRHDKTVCFRQNITT